MKYSNEFRFAMNQGDLQAAGLFAIAEAIEKVAEVVGKPVETREEWARRIAREQRATPVVDNLADDPPPVLRGVDFGKQDPGQ